MSDQKVNQDGGVLLLMEMAERDRQRNLNDTEAALDWALSVRAGVDALGRVDSVYRDADGCWRTHAIPAPLAAVLERARLRALARRDL